MNGSIKSKRVRVFVYGSLMRGFYNHHLLDDRDFVREAQTEARFELYSLGAFPAMVEGGATAIHGEVYEIDAATLGRLDRLEGHPNFYERKQILLSDGGLVWAYLLKDEQVRGRSIV